jgi:flagellar biosynthetic protein FliQ
MNQSQLIDIFQQMVWIMVLVSSPILITSMVVGVIISIFQAVTQIQEQTLTFVPKIMIGLFVFIFTSPWLVDTMVTYTQQIMNLVIELATQT